MKSVVEDPDERTVLEMLQDEWARIEEARRSAWRDSSAAQLVARIPTSVFALGTVPLESGSDRGSRGDVDSRPPPSS